LPALPQLPDMPKLPDLPAMATLGPDFPGSAVSVYTQIARGSNVCWFSAYGALDRNGYIWHAKVEPESKGGTAEILIHERVDKNQRGAKTFGVLIAPHGDNATVSAENIKMPEALGSRLKADAYRWARGGIGCVKGDTAWTPPAAAMIKAAEANPGNAKQSEAKKPIAKKKPLAVTEKASAGAVPAAQVKPHTQSVSDGASGSVTGGAKLRGSQDPMASDRSRDAAATVSKPSTGIPDGTTAAGKAP
jgi:hypothetical protein